MDCYRCSICLEFVPESIQSLVKHIGRIHRNEPNFHVVYGISSCPKTFKKFLSFKNHLICKHNIIAKNGKDVVKNQDENGLNVAIDNVAEHKQDENVFDLNNEEINLSRANALCILKFKEKGRVPQTVVDSFVENATQVAQTSIDLFKAGVTNCLQKAGIDVETVLGLQDLFDENNPISNPFNGIDKETLQYKYYKEKFNLVVSIKYILY